MKLYARFAGLLLAALVCFPPASADEGPGRIHTQTQASDGGVIRGAVDGARLSHAIAVERDLTRVFLGRVEEDGAGFRFERLPVGRYDLVLITRDGRLFEGLELGGEEEPEPVRLEKLAAGVAKADGFFNRHRIHRRGFAGERALVLVERLRDKHIFKHSGETLEAGVRRLEIISFQAAGDDWRMVRTRHIHRVEIPREAAPPFLLHRHLSALSNLRVAARERVLPRLDLTR